MESNIIFEESLFKGITDQNEIEKRLDNLKKENKNELFLKYLPLCYPILSPAICQKYNIHKTKTEKETLFNIINDLINRFGEIEEYKSTKTDKMDLYKYIDNNILNKPANEELKDLKLDKIESRWDIFYRKVINIEEETNNELIYYNLTNDILHNILKNDKPFLMISFFKSFMNVYNNLSTDIDNMPKILKKYLLLGLGNNEHDLHKDSNSFFTKVELALTFNKMKISEIELQNLLFKKNEFGIQLLNESIIKYSKSKLAKSAFKKIFQMTNIPHEIENEIFTDNIEKYICYFPYTSYSDIERTMKRFSLILINNYRNKKLLEIDNPTLNDLLQEFTNIVVRKYIFGHEHPHLSGTLLFINDKIERLGTPPHEITEDKNLKYLNNIDEKGERGEIFEKLAYGKVFKLFTLFDLLFIANEKNDELDIDSHLEEFQKYSKKKKDLKTLFKEFPAGQLLSNLVNKIYNELIKDNNTITYTSLTNKTIAYKKEMDNSNIDYFKILSDEENVVTTGICPLSVYKTPYRTFPESSDK